ncbi:MAG: ATP-binding protein [Candidatus Eisenbacteria bacterium]|nr:ATP-binding protein [Candidatus Eisenbacteria bacterium]
MAASKALIERLSKHRVLSAAPPAEIEWFAAHGELKKFRAGNVLNLRSAGRIEALYLLLEGRIAMYVERGGTRHRSMEWRAGDATGQLPYSRMKAPPGNTIAEEDTEVFAVHRDHFPEMIRECHEITSALVHVMIDRARQFTSNDLHDEKMLSLGRLAAGLAHELNNPASALARSAKLLPDRLRNAESASHDLGAAALSPEELAAIERVREICLATPVQDIRSPLEEARREAAIADWLEDHGLDAVLSEPLAETAITVDALDQLSRDLKGPPLQAALRSLAAGSSARRLAAEIEEAAIRIFDLVTAVKGFTRLDLAAVAEPVDIQQGLTQTLAVLRAKARTKGLAVSLAVEPDLPRVLGVAGEINQVWVNLVDNALDAASESGKVEIDARRGEGGKSGHVMVRIADDGPGIPGEIRDRIFDPFFTTKPVGQGTGLGLDIVRRLVSKHGGDIEVESAPGRTAFIVTLPALREEMASEERTAEENKAEENEAEGNMAEEKVADTMEPEDAPGGSLS